MADWKSLKPLKVHSQIMAWIIVFLILILLFTPRHVFRMDSNSKSEIEAFISDKKKSINSTITTQYKVNKRETWIYSKDSFVSNEDSKKYRVVKLGKGKIVNVISRNNGEDMVKVIYFDDLGKRYEGYMLVIYLNEIQ